jgi:hypothetical protein
MKYYFTFGYGTPLRNNYVVVEAESYGEARKRFIAARDNNFAFQYPEHDFAGMAEKFHLTEIPL